MVKEKIVFDDAMSWTDTQEDITKVQEEFKEREEFIDSGRYDQLKSHGIFASKYFSGFRVVDNSDSLELSFDPVLIVDDEQFISSEFHQYLKEIELFCEKIRHTGKITICLYVDVYRSDCIFIRFDSDSVGSWTFDCNAYHFDTKRKNKHTGKTFSSPEQIIGVLLEEGIGKRNESKYLRS